MNFDPKLVIEKLKDDKYNLFVSEQHFVTNFVIKAKEMYPNYIYVSEYPYYLTSPLPKYHDLVVFSDESEEYIILEFKWLCKNNKIIVPGNTSYSINDRANADTQKLFDCYKDISHLENKTIVSTFKNTANYFILLTNHNNVIFSENNDCPLNENSCIEPKTYIFTKKRKEKTKTEQIIINKKHGPIKYHDYLNSYKYICLKIEN